MTRGPGSIRSRLLVTLVPGVLGLSAVAGVGLYAYVGQVLEHGLDAALAAKAQAIAGAVHTEDDGQPHLLLSDADAAAAAGHAGPFYFQVWRADGRTLTRLAPPGVGDAALPRRPAVGHRPFADATLADGSAVRLTEVSFAPQADEDAYDAPRPPTTTAAAEPLTLVVAHDRRSIDGTLAVLLTGLSVTAVAMAAGVAAVVTWGVGRGLRPLAEVSRLADRVGPDALADVRFPAGDAVPAELRPIGTKLNDLLDRLAAAFARERRFSAAVAHELRTPLAELRSACDVALRWPDDRDAALAALVDARDVAVQMSVTVATLLTLARREAGADEAAGVGPVALAAAVTRAWPSPAVLTSRGLTAERHVPEDAVVPADPALLAAVLRNLFDNAVAHAPAGDHVRVTAERRADGGWSLSVANACRGWTPRPAPAIRAVLAGRPRPPGRRRGFARSRRPGPDAGAGLRRGDGRRDHRRDAIRSRAAVRAAVPGRRRQRSVR